MKSIPRRSFSKSIINLHQYYSELTDNFIYYHFTGIVVVLFIIVTILFFIYSLLILFYWHGWKTIPVFTASKPPTTKISIIIPARNEEKNIEKLLEAISNQTYPRNYFEVIVVDDHSTDRTAEIAWSFEDVRIIQLKEDGINSYKKKAIESGIMKATGELIVTTDADCVPPARWLETIAGFYEKTDARFTAAPVVLENNSSLLQVFQALDFLVLQGITAASVHKKFHSLSNGANLAYKKTAFLEVNGFEGIDSIASGDDLLLMHKIRKRSPDQIHYLLSKHAIVSTQPMHTWKEFLNQRIRWASKATAYQDTGIFFVLLLVYLFNFSFLVLFLAGFWSPVYWLFLAFLWLAKTLIEFPFVHNVAQFFQKRKLMVYFFFFQPLHIAYTILAGVLGQLGRYEWKGRRVK